MPESYIFTYFPGNSTIMGGESSTITGGEGNTISYSDDSPLQLWIQILPDGSWQYSHRPRKPRQLSMFEGEPSAER